MIFKNTTDFDSVFLKRMVSWIRRQYELPAAKLRKIEFLNTRHAYRGTAWHSGRIIIRIGAEGKHEYPRCGKYPDRVHAPVFSLEDRIEALVHVTAHEIAHLVRWHDGIRRNREARVDGMTLPILRAFRNDRADLMDAWSVPVAPARVKVSRAEKNERAARAALKKWEAKLKLAKTKVTKYKAKVRRYDKIAAAKAT